MTISARMAPPNSLVLVEDSGGGEVHISMNLSLIATTDSCIAIGCMSEDDGETEIFLGDCANIAIVHQPVFEGFLKTPNRKISVRTVHGVTLLEASVSDTETKVKILVNDLREPDRIFVCIQ